MLKLLIDENLDQRILRGLQLRVPDLLYTLVQETALALPHNPHPQKIVTPHSGS